MILCNKSLGAKQRLAQAAWLKLYWADAFEFPGRGPGRYGFFGPEAFRPTAGAVFATAG